MPKPINYYKIDHNDDDHDEYNDEEDDDKGEEEHETEDDLAKGANSASGWLCSLIRSLDITEGILWRFNILSVAIFAEL